MLKVAVVLCTFNGEKYVIDQIESILNQIFVYVDVYVFDDKSEDNTVEILNLYGNKDKVEIFVNSERSGSAAKNFLSSLRTVYDFQRSYDYYALADQDDIWAPCKLVQSIAEMKIKSLDLYASDLSAFRNEEHFFIRKSNRLTDFSFNFQSLSAGCTYVLSPRMVSKVPVVDKLSLGTYFSHDWFLYYLCQVNSYDYFCDSITNIRYRIHESNVFGSISLGGFKSSFVKFSYLLNNYFGSAWRDFESLIGPNSNLKSVSHMLTLSNFEFLKFCFNNASKFSTSYLKSIILVLILIHYKISRSYE
jgi:rhamnosyltransferase